MHASKEFSRKSNAKRDSKEGAPYRASAAASSAQDLMEEERGIASQASATRVSIQDNKVRASNIFDRSLIDIV